MTTLSSSSVAPGSCIGADRSTRHPGEASGQYCIVGKLGFGRRLLRAVVQGAGWTSGKRGPLARARQVTGLVHDSCPGGDCGNQGPCCWAQSKRCVGITRLAGDTAEREGRELSCAWVAELQGIRLASPRLLDGEGSGAGPGFAMLTLEHLLPLGTPGNWLPRPLWKRGEEIAEARRGL